MTTVCNNFDNNDIRLCYKYIIGKYVVILPNITQLYIVICRSPINVS